MTTRLEAIEARVDKCALKWGDDDVEIVNQRLLLAVVQAAAELPPGFLYSLVKDMRRRGGQVEMQLADAIEAVAKAIAPLLEGVTE